MILIRSVFLVLGSCLILDPAFSMQDKSVVQDAYVKASNTGSYDRFGLDVAVWGDTMVIGAPNESSGASGIDGDQLDNSAPDAGAVYVLVRNGTTWEQQAYLKASNPEAYDYFGAAVDIHGDTIMVGAWGEDSAATGVGGVQSDNSASEAGAVYVFERVGTTWSQSAYLKASNTDAEDQFGRALAIGSDLLVVSAVGESSNTLGVDGDQLNNGFKDSGAAYVFERSGGTWSQQAYLKASNTNSLDQFGSSVQVQGERIAIGAIFEASQATGIGGSQLNGMFGAGAVYVFERSAGLWGQTTYIKASNTGPGDFFGWSLALSGDTLVVGAQLEDSAATGIGGDQLDDSAAEAGAVYVFTHGGSGWTQTAYLKASNTDVGDNFGVDVGLSGDRLVVGASYEDSWAVGVGGDQTNDWTPESGAAYLFERQEFGTTWTQKAYMKASNTRAWARFGNCVGISSETIVVSSPYESSAATGVGGDQSSTAANNSGAAYVFDLASTCGTQKYGFASPVNIGSLDSNQLPFPGLGFTLDLSGFQGNGVALLALSTGFAGLPLWGGTLYVDLLQGVPAPGATFPVTLVAGAGHLVVPVPPGSAGLVVYAQAGMLDLSMPSWIALSNGLRIEICP